MRIDKRNTVATLTMTGRIMGSFSQRRTPKREPVLPDPAVKYPHSENRELFAFLKRGWAGGSRSKSRWEIDGYPLCAHPDLLERFRTLAPAGDMAQSSAYGVPVMANSTGLVFAYARGMN